MKFYLKRENLEFIGMFVLDFYMKVEDRRVVWDERLVYKTEEYTEGSRSSIATRKLIRVPAYMNKNDLSG